MEQPTALLLTIAVDFLIDGLLIGIAFSAGAREGFLITLALTIEAFFLSLTATGAFRRTGVSALSVLLLAGGFAILLAAGAVAGIVILGNLPAAVLAGLLAFGAAALLYLVTEELLVEAHHVPETPLLQPLCFSSAFCCSSSSRCSLSRQLHKLIKVALTDGWPMHSIPPAPSALPKSIIRSTTIAVYVCPTPRNHSIISHSPPRARPNEVMVSKAGAITTGAATYSYLRAYIPTGFSTRPLYPQGAICMHTVRYQIPVTGCIILAIHLSVRGAS
ncbi:MAG: hypothetical protein KatS3mg057_0140 [Herpetosiphonaceae bacterium]|nr:MAG: hypothetical protein KatS3mg057_0140 [Herpetosiphonaceae bacterium]